MRVDSFQRFEVAHWWKRFRDKRIQKQMSSSLKNSKSKPVFEQRSLEAEILRGKRSPSELAGPGYDVIYELTFAPRIFETGYVP